MIVNTRKVKLLSGVDINLRPAEWVQVAGVKEFDASGTQILRVFSAKNGSGTGYVYGMRAVSGKIEAEAYELTATPELVSTALAAVAGHCGLAGLVEKVR